MKNAIPESSWGAVRMAVEELQAAVSGWEDNRSPERSYHLLAAWAHSMRFRAATLNAPSVLDGIDNAVRASADLLIVTALRVPSPLAEFEAVAEALDDQWGAVEDEDHERLGSEILGHFIAFDRERLFVQAVSFLIGGFVTSEWNDEFMVREARVIAVEKFILEHPELFITAADYAQVMLGAYRADLSELDPGDPTDAPLVEVMNHLVVFWRIKTAPHFCAGYRAAVVLRPSERAAIRTLMDRRQSRQDPPVA